MRLRQRTTHSVVDTMLHIVARDDNGYTHWNEGFDGMMAPNIGKACEAFTMARSHLPTLMGQAQQPIVEPREVHRIPKMVGPVRAHSRPENRGGQWPLPQTLQ